MRMLARRGWCLIGAGTAILVGALCVLLLPNVQAAPAKPRTGQVGGIAHVSQPNAPAVRQWRTWARPAPPSSLAAGQALSPPPPSTAIPNVPSPRPQAAPTVPSVFPLSASAAGPPEGGANPAGAVQDSSRLAVAPPTSDYRVLAPPSVSAALLDEVLAQYHSPASGQGGLFYDLGVQYGIDPAYLLAYYIHESQAGTQGVARFTMSIGNIRTTPGYRDYEGYRAYDSWQASAEDWYKLIKELYIEGWGLYTVAQIIPRYAPASDHNDEQAYITSVTDLVASWRR